MGWASGTNKDGREIGYGVKASCDAPSCRTRIDRGLYYVCGGMHDGDEHGCGRYFCPEHLDYYCDDEAENPETVQLCSECGLRYTDQGQRHASTPPSEVYR